MNIIEQKGRFVNMKIKMHCSTGMVGSDHEAITEIPDNELKGMTEEEKEDYINNEYLIPFVWEHIDMHYEEI